MQWIDAQLMDMIKCLAVEPGRGVNRFLFPGLETERPLCYGACSSLAMRPKLWLLALDLLSVMFLCNVKQIVTAARELPMLQKQAVIVFLFGAQLLCLHSPAKFKPYGSLGRDFLQALSSYSLYYTHRDRL